MKRPPLDPELLRDRLAAAQGKSYWRGLEEIAADPAVREMIEREFPHGASEWNDPVSRRRFLTLMGASLALAGLSGCVRPPTGTIRPFVRQPENLVPGKPLFYATSMTLSGYATGLLVESHEGRPTKIEGNPLHPASLGATSAIHQASVLGLYDPDRARTVTFRGQPRAWGDLVEELRNRLRSGREKGQRVAILTEAVGSPTLDWQLDEFLRDYPQARWFTYEPVNRDNVHAGSRLAFNNALHHTYHRMERANVIVSLDADFLGRGPAQLADTRAFTSRRRSRGPKDDMNRLYVVETDVTITGAKADHRLALRPGEVEAFGRELARKLGLPGVPTAETPAEATRFVDAIAADLDKHRERCLVVAGDGQPPSLHALVHALNQRLGNVGRTVIYTEPVLPAQGESMAKLADLVKLLETEGTDAIDTLLILGGNPAYTAPADIDLARRLTRHLASYSREKWLAVHCSPYFDETARLCHWHVPQSHYLEAWSDAVAFDGTRSIVQPLIAPLYASKSLHEVVASISRRTNGTSEDFDDRTGLELVQDYWRANSPEEARKEGFDAFWQKSLHDGVIEGTAARPVTPALDTALTSRLEPLPARPSGQTYDVTFAPDPGVYDGRFANLGWLQEWPRPISKLTWDNAALMSVATARKLGVSTKVGNWRGGEHGDMLADKVRLTLAGKSLEAPVFIVPGHADDAVTLYLGYGRTRAGRVATKVGVNANAIRTSSGASFARGVKVDKVSGTHRLACVQGHHGMEGRDIVRSGTFAQFQKDRYFLQKHDLEGGGRGPDADQRRKELPTLVPQVEYPGYKWGMAVDLTACTGCGACVTACQAENNVPIVGKEQVTRGREMQWLRIDRYFETPADRIEQPPRSWHFQPVMCQHCEMAPCELVCPVEATVHGDEGTNDMVYNRCVGTRYCSHNCPYKVRRFNFLTFTDYATPSLKLMYNPDVTVRSRGVMEKCTFCIQRISYARIEASKEQLDGIPERVDPNGRMVQGTRLPYIDTTEKGLKGNGPELVTACQAACPAEAIVFGDLGDKNSRVSKLHASPLRYDLLGDHGTLPRVAYLGELRNPNPALEPKRGE